MQRISRSFLLCGRPAGIPQACGRLARGELLSGVRVQSQFVGSQTSMSCYPAPEFSVVRRRKCRFKVS